MIAVGVVSVWVIEVAASVVWVIAAAVMSVRVTVGEIVGLVVGGIVGEVVGRTVDGAVGDAVGEVGTSLHCKSEAIQRFFLRLATLATTLPPRLTVAFRLAAATWPSSRFFSFASAAAVQLPAPSTPAIGVGSDAESNVPG